MSLVWVDHRVKQSERGVGCRGVEPPCIRKLFMGIGESLNRTFNDFSSTHICRGYNIFVNQNFHFAYYNADMFPNVVLTELTLLPVSDRRPNQSIRRF